MALINCPECKGVISSVADACVHCGCKITVCPDCGASHAGETAACSECGYNFQKAAEIKNGKSFKGLLDYWKASKPVDKIISRIIPIIFSVIGAAFIAFLIMAVTNVIRLGYNEDNAKLFKIGVSVTVAVIFSVVFFVMLIAMNILHSSFITFSCGAWIRDNEIDVKRFTDQLRELPRSKRTFKNNREIRSAYVAEHPREFSKTVIISAICGLFYIVCFIIACVFLSEGIDAYIVNKAFSEGEGNLLTTIDWILLLIPTGIMAVSLTTDIIFRVLLRKKVKAWLGYPTVKAEPEIKPENKAAFAESTETVAVTEEKTPVTDDITVEEDSTASEEETDAQQVEETLPAEEKAEEESTEQKENEEQ